MKMKNFSFCILLLFVISVHAQFTTGQKLLSGGVNFGNTNYNYGDSIKQNSLAAGLNFSLGKFISPLHSIGFGLSYSISNYTQKQPGVANYKNQMNYLGASFFSQYYFPLAKKFYAFLQWNSTAGINFGSVTGYSNNFKGYSIATGLNPGLSYKLNKRFLFNASLTNLVSLSYSHSKNNPNVMSGNGVMNSFTLSSSLNSGSVSNIGLGFIYLIQ